MYRISLWIMAVLYVAAGVNHFLHPPMYVAIMPKWLPASSYGVLVAVSGVCEVLFGLLLLPVATRGLAAWLIIALLVAVFPANIQMAVDLTRQHNSSAWLTYFRLPVQGLLIWWAYAYTYPRG